MRLTDIAIRNLKLQGKQQKFFDDSFPQFGVRLNKSSKSFILMYGENRRMKTFGRYPETSLKQAREEARRFLALDGGKHRPTPQMLYKDAVEIYLEEAVSRLRPETYRTYLFYLSNAPCSGTLREITRLQIKSYIQHPHTLVAMKVFFNWCVRNELMNRNPLAGERAVYNAPRERILTDDELILVYNRANQIGYPFGHIVLMCIFTGQRRSEVGRLKWEYISDDEITIPAEVVKNNRTHYFPYGTMTKQLLETIPHTSEYLFTGRFEGVFNGYSKCKKRFDKELDIEHYTLHDLRRTFASTHARLGTPIQVVEKMLNHVSGSFAGVTGIYNRYSYQGEMREACINYEKHLVELFKPIALID
ncbi:MAG: tyrosine-type recombinase/integrase [Bacteroidetes bacterium]|nr:tyrosine-type recombinase/integrase [Bacteroidota bacterium]